MDKLFIDSLNGVLHNPNGTPLANLLNFLSLVKEECGKGSWVGLYIYSKKDDVLLLGPFQGKEACLSIKPGKGVVGECFNKRAPIYIKDVSLIENYISCDAATKSEYVYPLINNKGQVVAIFDIDSSELDGLNEKLLFLKKCAELLNGIIEEIEDFI